MAQENISAQLNDLLVSRNFDPEMLDYQGRPAVPEEATVFSFDYTSSAGKDYGTMVIVLDNENDLQVFYGDNLGRSMEGDDKSEFFDFIQHLHKFANMRRWTFSPKDITRVKNTMQGLAAIKEGLFEGYYGTRKISYSGEPTEARLVIKHNRVLGETDARFRYVESLFIETADSERFRLPFKNLAGGRAMLEHVRQGGKPYDIRGSHIAEMVAELATLSRFNRASRSRVLEGATAELVTEAQEYYRSLQENLKRLGHSRGYHTYFEAWHPADVTKQEELVENIKTLFVEQTIDNRIEQALPLLAKIKENSMKEVEIFENWVDQISEGTWAVPDTPEKIQQLRDLLSNELVVGPDATNATELLYDLVGDDELFDQLQAIAQDDPDADVREVVQQRLQQLGVDLDNEPGVEFTDQTGEADDEELDEDAVADFLARGGQIQTGKFHKPRQSEKTDYGSRHIGTVGGGGKPGKVSGLGANTRAGAKPVVAVEASTCNHTMEGEMCPEHGLAECGMHETYDPSMDPEYRRPEPRRVDPDDRDQEPVGYGSGPALQRSPEQEREFEKYMRYLNRDQKGVAEGAHWSDEWEPVKDIETKTGQVVGMVMRHSSGTYAYYDDRKSNIESGFSSAEQARQAFVELHNARVRSNNPGVAEGSNDDPMNYNAAITGSYYESKQDPLERLKTLALNKK
jgi:hypothetical protein